MTAANPLFKTLGTKFIVFLLIVNIAATPLAVLAIMENTQALSQSNRAFVEEQSKQTRSTVDTHANDTLAALAIVKAEKEQSDKLLIPLLDQWTDIQIKSNQTNAAVIGEVPTQLELDQKLDRIIELLEQQTGNNSNITTQ